MSAIIIIIVIVTVVVYHLTSVTLGKESPCRSLSGQLGMAHADGQGTWV